MTFRQLTSIGMRQWTYEQTKFVLNDCRAMYRNAAKYILKKKYQGT